MINLIGRHGKKREASNKYRAKKLKKKIVLEAKREKAERSKVKETARDEMQRKREAYLSGKEVKG